MDIEELDLDDSDVEDLLVVYAAATVCEFVANRLSRPHRANNVASSSDDEPYGSDEELNAIARQLKDARDVQYLKRHRLFFQRQWHHVLEHPRQFQEVFRLNRRSFRMVSEWIRDGIKKRRARGGRPPTLSPEEHLLLFLYHLGQGWSCTGRQAPRVSQHVRCLFLRRRHVQSNGICVSICKVHHRRCCATHASHTRGRQMA